MRCSALRIAVQRNPPHFFLRVQKETGWSLKERARQRGLLAPLWKPPARRLKGIQLPTIAVTAHPCNARSRHLARTQAVRALRRKLLRSGCGIPPSSVACGCRASGRAAAAASLYRVRNALKCYEKRKRLAGTDKPAGRFLLGEMECRKTWFLKIGINPWRKVVLAFLTLVLYNAYIDK